MGLFSLKGSNADKKMILISDRNVSKTKLIEINKSTGGPKNDGKYINNFFSYMDGKIASPLDNGKKNYFHNN